MVAPTVERICAFHLRRASRDAKDAGCYDRAGRTVRINPILVSKPTRCHWKSRRNSNPHLIRRCYGDRQVLRHLVTTSCRATNWLFRACQPESSQNPRSTSNSIINRRNSGLSRSGTRPKTSVTPLTDFKKPERIRSVPANRLGN